MKNGNGTAAHRPDFAAIAGWINSGSSVLDLGCGDGTLLRYLKETRRTTGYGVEIDDSGVLACVKNGVSVVQSDLEIVGELVALMAQIGLDLKFRVEGIAELAVLQLSAKLGSHLVVRQIGDVSDHSRDAQ